MSGWTVRVLEWDALAGSPWRERLRGEVEEALAGVAGSGQVVVDERCPGVDAGTLRAMLRAVTDGLPRVGVRPVTDTVKRLRDGVVLGTVDRSELLQVTGPLVVPGDIPVVVRESLAATAQWLDDVVTVEMPDAVRRFADDGDLRIARLSP